MLLFSMFEGEGGMAIYVFDLRDPFDERRYGPTVRRAFIFFPKLNFSMFDALRSRLVRLKLSISVILHSDSA
jgi:hypothetical protein